MHSHNLKALKDFLLFTVYYSYGAQVGLLVDTLSGSNLEQLHSE